MSFRKFHADIAQNGTPERARREIFGGPCAGKCGPRIANGRGMVYNDTATR